MKIGTTSWLLGSDYLANAQLVAGKFDFMELLVYSWNEEIRGQFEDIIIDLWALDLEYTVHLPMDTVDNALEAARFFNRSGFPLLNMVLHPLPGWQRHAWPALTSVENLVETVDIHERMTLDVSHAFLGKPFPDTHLPKVVELHLCGVDEGVDHLPLNQRAVELASPHFHRDQLVCLEIFSPQDAFTALEILKNCTERTLG
ncbi:hypothetical protein [Desulfogranum japonicum]|uniref:hypothetical protein n=1 Tax=Desulfogranum japonicum TaxID=231447 RepID=UPI0003FA5F0F|nr:hypothetical protein [Desulfogranum japonicum]